jgi:hypothetical protein
MGGVTLALLLSAGLVACAPQQQAAPVAAPAPTAAASPAPAAAPANHQETMAHCAEMRQQARTGATVTADMQRMMTYCQHMDHTMGSQRGRSTSP